MECPDLIHLNGRYFIMFTTGFRLNKLNLKSYTTGYFLETGIIKAKLTALQTLLNF